jgi:serpin B
MMRDAVRQVLVTSGWLTALMATCACTGAVSPESPPGPKPGVCAAPQGASANAQSLAAADTAFAVDFFPAAVAAAGGQGANVILSPYSVSAAMTMVDVGARGQTASQIESVLHLPSSGVDEAPAYAALECSEESDGTSSGNALFIANAVWAQSGDPFEPAFEGSLATGYDAPLEQVDFAGNPGAAISQINGWVSDKTQGAIPSLVGSGDIDPTTRLVLANAIYFKGVWADGFDPGQTKPAPFTRADGSQVSVPTMTGTVHVPYTWQSSLMVVEVPYKGGALAMDFFLPSATSGGLAAFESALTPSSLTSALENLGTAGQAILNLPRFSFTTHVELAPVLVGMGMTDAFDPTRADLSGMDGAMDLSVHAVVQQALVEVDEQGTVAAAATAVSVCSECNAVTEPETITLDHPFLFLVRDVRSGGILFMGHVTDPSKP